MQGHERDAFAEAVESDNRGALHTAAGRSAALSAQLGGRRAAGIGVPAGPQSTTQGSKMATKLPTYETIAKDLDRREGYLIRRCLMAEGKSLNDREAMIELLTDIEEAAPYTQA